MSSPITITQPRILFVEGNDEVCFFNKFITEMGFSGVQIVNMSGKDNYKSDFKSLMQTTGFRENARVLGIVRDAHDSPEGTFQSIRAILKSNGFLDPDEPLKLTDAKDGIKTIVLILPSIAETGEIEDLCLKSITEEAVMNCVDSYFECLSSQGVDTSYKEPRKRLQVYLASKHDPESRVGLATQKGYFPLDSATFDSVRTFLQIVCSE